MTGCNPFETYSSDGMIIPNTVSGKISCSNHHQPEDMWIRLNLPNAPGLARVALVPVRGKTWRNVSSYAMGDQKHQDPRISQDDLDGL